MLASFPSIALAVDWQPSNPLGISSGANDYCRKARELYPVETPALTSDTAEVINLADPQAIIPHAIRINAFCIDGGLAQLSIIIAYENSYNQDKDQLLDLLRASFDRSFECPEQPIPSDACALFMSGSTFTIFTANENETGYSLIYTHTDDQEDLLKRIQQLTN